MCISSFKAQAMRRRSGNTIAPLLRREMPNIFRKEWTEKSFITMESDEERFCTQKNNFVSIKLFYSLDGGKKVPLFDSFFFRRLVFFIMIELEDERIEWARLKLMKRVFRKLKIVYFAVCCWTLICRFGRCDRKVNLFCSINFFSLSLAMVIARLFICPGTNSVDELNRVWLGNLYHSGKKKPLVDYMRGNNFTWACVAWDLIRSLEKVVWSKLNCISLLEKMFRDAKHLNRKSFCWEKFL